MKMKSQRNKVQRETRSKANNLAFFKLSPPCINSIYMLLYKHEEREKRRCKSEQSL